jgi:hypothetical protein
MIATGLRKGFSIEGWLGFIEAESLSEVKTTEAKSLDARIDGLDAKLTTLITTLESQAKPTSGEAIKPNIQKMSTKAPPKRGLFGAFNDFLKGMKEGVQKLEEATKTEEISLGQFTLADGTMIEIVDDSKEVYVLDAEGNRGDLLADGTYTTQDGTMEIVVVDGKATEENEIEASAVPANPPANTEQKKPKPAAPAAKPTTEALRQLALTSVRTRAASEQQMKDVKAGKAVEMAIVMGDDSTLMDIDTRHGYVRKLDEYGWPASYVDPGTYTLITGETLAVVASTESREIWMDGAYVQVDVEVNKMDWANSTIDITTLLPWTKTEMAKVEQQMKEVQMAIDKANADVTAAATKTAEDAKTIAELRAKLAATEKPAKVEKTEAVHAKEVQPLMDTARKTREAYLAIKNGFN